MDLLNCLFYTGTCEALSDQVRTQTFRTLKEENWIFFNFLILLTACGHPAWSQTLGFFVLDTSVRTMVLPRLHSVLSQTTMISSSSSVLSEVRRNSQWCGEYYSKVRLTWGDPVLFLVYFSCLPCRTCLNLEDVLYVRDKKPFLMVVRHSI